MVVFVIKPLNIVFRFFSVESWRKFPNELYSVKKDRRDSKLAIPENYSCQLKDVLNQIDCTRFKLLFGFRLKLSGRCNRYG